MNTTEADRPAGTNELGRMEESEEAEDLGRTELPGDPLWMAQVWVGLGVLTIVLSGSVAYRPSFDDTWQSILTVVTPVVFALILLVLAAPLVKLAATVLHVAAALAIGGWALLLFQHDDWVILTFVIYAVGFTAFDRFGLAAAGVISALWASAWLYLGAPPWMVVIPAGVFVVSVLIWVDIRRSAERTIRQAHLIQQLTETRAGLAASERTKGILEERARFAGEIHDTLAQGFTSIVLLSRAGMRTGDATNSLSEIERTALENLAAARRLVDAIGPAELGAASLPDALDRQVTNSLPPEVAGRFEVVGSPRRLSGTVEVTLLRATQEALLNVRTHAKANEVEVTLTYLDDVVALDIRDDGIGFVPDRTSDRGQLTGGQGLRVLENRAKALAGELTIEGRDSGGSVVSVLLPTADV
ncbi:MAG: sensor histidine kinase [Actinomycetota bacterium]